ncbi:F0F1 ATP synthase subunit delta [Canicola haemoglobinophilus]|uniref:ATP synthase subunit delta n=1 Tax=Canicola haemoglobinophilus TaxID=733 RepID=A0AB38HC88_9PAST|nr:F0F1 ATP synthase subunit delta [Canicola haemoglobinophilus]STO55190.1 F0F1 ATP synthase subunit delta [Canicola haemoglobinophilus]STO69239.1 F0F1 ATP synthase subunit delta [Canicola haemoglobinophilus]
MSELTTIARPYAKAAFDFAVEQSEQDKSAVEKWTNMLAFLAELIHHDKVQLYLTSSNSTLKLADTVISICGEQLDQYGQNLVRLMAENKRLAALPAVFNEFKSYVEEYNSIAQVEVISAQPLNDAQQQKIVTAMKKRLARKVKLNCRIDSSLIAGAIIRTNDFVIDGSSRGQISRLANELQL